MIRASKGFWLPMSVWACGVLIVACGGAASTGEPAAAPGVSSSAPSEDDNSLPMGQEVPSEGSSSREASDVRPRDDAASPEAAKSAATEPEFRAGMTVNEAINAVPSDAQRINVDQETLEEPLVRAELYEPCKLTPSQHFKLRVAVWEGRAVGVDIETQPKNDKLAACLRERVEAVRWSNKAKSLNTVEYAF